MEFWPVNATPDKNNVIFFRLLHLQGKRRPEISPATTSDIAGPICSTTLPDNMVKAFQVSCQPIAR